MEAHDSLWRPRKGNSRKPQCFIWSPPSITTTTTLLSAYPVSSGLPQRIIVLFAELRFENGKSQKISVNVENSLSSLIKGINYVNTNVSQLLSELVEQEKARGACVGEEEDSEEDNEEDDHPNCDLHPPAKKSKT
ncbi:hypothetical protein Q8A73_018015 [Channa argus]|nr:hypothetical protein Q8A73_018015 [Channa argus]